ncbi:proximal promoter DNA-binding transcription repressor, RNA polymerase II-specific [Branchiostoma belcheri]|nr:proximal promoter DNA-binding transcription repressor, RNA polymerase II-specific [Branchiostoma belcheri]
MGAPAYILDGAQANFGPVYTGQIDHFGLLNPNSSLVDSERQDIRLPLVQQRLLAVAVGRTVRCDEKSVTRKRSSVREFLDKRPEKRSALVTLPEDRAPTLGEHLPNHHLSLKRVAMVKEDGIEHVVPHAADSTYDSDGHALAASQMMGEAVAMPTESLELQRVLNVRRKDVLSSRKRREFIPDEKKDNAYWDKRRKNNEAAKRSREKRRLNDMVLETRVLQLTQENARLRAEMYALKQRLAEVTSGPQQRQYLSGPPSPPAPVQYPHVYGTHGERTAAVYTQPFLNPGIQYAAAAYDAAEADKPHQQQPPVLSSDHSQWDTESTTEEMQPVGGLTPQAVDLSFAKAERLRKGSSEDDNSSLSECHSPVPAEPLSRPPSLSPTVRSSILKWGSDEKCLPHKLRLKLSAQHRDESASCHSGDSDTSPDSPVMPALSGTAEHPSGDHPELQTTTTTHLSNSNPREEARRSLHQQPPRPGSPADPELQEKRRRNSEKARRSRELRRMMVSYHTSRSTHLQTENSHLRQEVSLLSAEIFTLKHMLEKKREAISFAEADSIDGSPHSVDSLI